MFDITTGSVANLSRSNLEGAITCSSEQLNIASSISNMESMATPGIPPEAKTIMRQRDGGIYVTEYDNARPTSYEKYIMPDISAVNVYFDDAGEKLRAVKMKFSDGTVTKAVVSESDDEISSLEEGLTICIAKKLLDLKIKGGGQSIFNKIIKRAGKVYVNGEMEKERARKEEAEAKARVERGIRKYRERCAKQEEAMREQKISIQKEAYVRAMKELYPVWFNTSLDSWQNMSAQNVGDDLK